MEMNHKIGDLIRFDEDSLSGRAGVQIEDEIISFEEGQDYQDQPLCCRRQEEVYWSVRAGEAV